MRDQFSKPAKAVYSSVETTYTADSETGEVLMKSQSVKEVTRKEGVQHLTFTKMFYQDLGRLYDLSKSAMILFVELSSMIKDDKNQVILTQIERTKIFDRTKLGKQTIYNATRELIKSGLLVRVVENVYMIDPNIFSVGSDPSVLENRRKYENLRRISVLLQYTEEGRAITVSID